MYSFLAHLFFSLSLSLSHSFFLSLSLYLSLYLTLFLSLSLYLSLSLSLRQASPRVQVDEASIEKLGEKLNNEDPTPEIFDDIQRKVCVCVCVCV